MIMVVIITIWYLFGIFKLSFAMLNPQGCPASYLLQKKNVLVSIFFPSQSLIVAAFVSFLSHFFITSIYWLTCSHTKYAWNICSWSFRNQQSIKLFHHIYQTANRALWYVQTRWSEEYQTILWITYFCQTCEYTWY
jgi:hypothetical protein